MIRETVFETTGQIVVYWLIKYSALFCGLLISIALTICWEGVIACALLRSLGKDRILKATVSANLLFFFFVFFVGACLAWPERMRNRDWLLPPS